MEFDSHGDPAIETCPVRSMRFGAITLEGYSRAGVQSYWRVPEWKLAFDIGAMAWDFRHASVWCISHAHLDHIAALPVMVARRWIMGLSPPTVLVPAESLAGVQELLDIFQKLDKGSQDCTLIGVEAGDRFDLGPTRYVEAWATEHPVPSRGYVVWEKKRKIRPEYADLKSNEVARLRKQGVEVADVADEPLLAYTGDTNAEGLDRCPAAFLAKLLVMECSFYRAGANRERVSRFGHVHIDDVAERAGKFQNEAVVFAHLSTRHTPAEAQAAIDKLLPESLRSRIVVWS